MSEEYVPNAIRFLRDALEFILKILLLSMRAHGEGHEDQNDEHGTCEEYQQCDVGDMSPSLRCKYFCSARAW